jgi:hypothetical protein
MQGRAAVLGRAPAVRQVLSGALLPQAEQLGQAAKLGSFRVAKVGTQVSAERPAVRAARRAARAARAARVARGALTCVRSTARRAAFRNSIVCRLRPVAWWRCSPKTSA